MMETLVWWKLVIMVYYGLKHIYLAFVLGFKLGETIEDSTRDSCM
jgi:hypothetical protein